MNESRSEKRILPCPFDPDLKNSDRLKMTCTPNCPNFNKLKREIIRQAKKQGRSEQEVIKDISDGRWPNFLPIGSRKICKSRPRILVEEVGLNQ